MPISATQSDCLTKLAALMAEQKTLVFKLKERRLEFQSLGVGSLTTEDLHAVPGLNHLTAEVLDAYIAAIDRVDTAVSTTGAVEPMASGSLAPIVTFTQIAR